MRRERRKQNRDSKEILELALRQAGSKTYFSIHDEDRDGHRRPGRISIGALVAYLGENLELGEIVEDGEPEPEPPDEVALAVAGTVEIVELTGTSGQLTNLPSVEPVVVIEAAHVVLSLAPSSIPAANEYFRDGTAIHVNTARADSDLKLAYPYLTPAINPGFEPFTAVGTAVTLTTTPIMPPLLVYPEGHIILTETATPMGPNHFTRSGRVLTLDATRADISGLAIYSFGPHTILKQESLDPGGYPTFNATLADTPIEDERVLAIYGPANLPLAFTTGPVGPNDFSVLFTALESGRELTEGNQLHVLYPIA